MRREIKKNNKKNKSKLNILSISKLTAIILSGSYVISGFSHGFKKINQTIAYDVHSIIYNMDYLTSDIESRNINDLRINQMSSINTLRIDMAKVKDLSFLSYYTDLKSIEISNAQELTDENIHQLNLTNIKEIYLFFDREIVLNKLDEGFDLNRFKNKKIIKDVNFMNRKSKDDGIIRDSKEINAIVFFEYLKNTKDCNLSFMKYAKLNNELDKIIEFIDNNDEEVNNSTIEYLFSIVDYITEHLKYDEEVKKLNKSSEDLSFREKKKLNDKIDDYNTYSLSQGLLYNEARERPSICTNYSDALLALGIKKGLNIHAIKGECNGVGHAWNTVNFGGVYYIIDLTNYEKLIETRNLIQEYRNKPTQENYEEILHNLLIMINMESLGYYNSYFNILEYVEPTVRENSTNNIYGTNDNKYAVFVMNTCRSIGGFCIFCLALVAYEIIKKKREYQKNKGKCKKILDRFSQED